jgi:hypothetical protein
MIISGQSIVIFDSLCSGPRSRTRFNQKNKNILQQNVFFLGKVIFQNSISIKMLCRKYGLIKITQWTDF